MGNFKILESRSELPSTNSEWRNCPLSKYTNLRFNEKGQSVPKIYSGFAYEVIAKQMRKYSPGERYRRGLLGAAAVICTLALALFFKQVRDLFIKDHKSIKFAIPIKKVTERDTDSILTGNHDLNLRVFSFLGVRELGRCEALSKSFRSLASTDSLWQDLPLPSCVFGKKEWTKYLGDIGDEPYLSKRAALKLLNADCPLSIDKKTKDTHLLVLIPSHIDGRPLSLNRWIEIINAPKKRNSKTYTFRTSRDFPAFDHVFKKEAPPSHWVLMAKKTTLDCRAHLISESILRLNKRAKTTYQLPSTLDAATILWMNYFASQEQIFRGLSMSGTACQEENPDRTISISFPFTSSYSEPLSSINRFDFKSQLARYL
jgi:hypothetical protein